MTTNAPTHDLLLADLIELNGNIDDLLAKHQLSPQAFLAFAKDPLVLETLDALEAFRDRHARIIARQHQILGAGPLLGSIMDSPSTAETRRAATALTRLTAHLQKSHAPKPRAKPRRRSRAAPSDPHSPQPAPRPVNSTAHPSVHPFIHPDPDDHDPRANLLRLRNTLDALASNLHHARAADSADSKPPLTLSTILPFTSSWPPAVMP